MTRCLSPLLDNLYRDSDEAGCDFSCRSCQHDRRWMMTPWKGLLDSFIHEEEKSSRGKRSYDTRPQSCINASESARGSESLLGLKACLYSVQWEEHGVNGNPCSPSRLSFRQQNTLNILRKGIVIIISKLTNNAIIELR